MSKWARRAAIAGGAGAAAYVVDDRFCYSCGMRSARVVVTGVYLLYQYKIRWTPENSSEVHRRVAHQIALTLKANEGMYIKFGQMLTSMSHVLPPEYPDELAVLFCRANTYEGSEMMAVVERSLGRKIDDMFLFFDEVPVASASMAQVHKAVLKSGEEVAVKIQKPNVSYQHGIDFAMVWLVLSVLEFSFSIPMLWSHNYVSERYSTELDFTLEARNSDLAKKLLHEYDDKKIYVPTVHHDLCSRRVLVTEWISDATRIDDLVGLRKIIDQNDTKEVMQTAVGLFAHSIFETGHVHCDPHPGNLLVRKSRANRERAGKGKRERSGEFELVLLDHGLYVDLSDELRMDYAAFWCAMVLADRAKLEEISRKWGIADAEFFASMTQMRPYKLDRGLKQMMSTTPHKLTSQQLAEIHLKMKGKLTHILTDTAAFPKELLFVGRALNYLRAQNWCHGSVVNRVQILGFSAAKGLDSWHQLRFHATFYVLRALEHVKSHYSSLWSFLLRILPDRASAALGHFGSVLDSAPEVTVDI